MITPEEAVRDRVLAILGDGSPVFNHVYTDLLPESPQYPCVLIKLIDHTDFYEQAGRSNIGNANILVEVFAHEDSGGDPYYTATRLAQEIDGDGLTLAGASGLAGWRGTAGSPAVAVDVAFRVSRRRGYLADELRVSIISQEYKLWFHPFSS